jgi:hypothetical protein
VRRGLFLLGLAFALASPASASETQFFRIQYVIDGDTVVLANGEHVGSSRSTRRSCAATSATASRHGRCCDG